VAIECGTDIAKLDTSGGEEETYDELKKAFAAAIKGKGDLGS